MSELFHPIVMPTSAQVIIMAAVMLIIISRIITRAKKYFQKQHRDLMSTIIGFIAGSIDCLASFFILYEVITAETITIMLCVTALAAVIIISLGIYLLGALILVAITCIQHWFETKSSLRS